MELADRRVIRKPGSPILEIGQEDVLIGQDNMQLQLFLWYLRKPLSIPA
jgi:hypothetical protein